MANYGIIFFYSTSKNVILYLIISYSRNWARGRQEISMAELGPAGQTKEKESNAQAVEDRMSDLGGVEMKLVSVGMGKGRHRQS